MDKSLTSNQLNLASTRSENGVIAWLRAHALTSTIAAFGLVLVVALGLRLATYDRYLPYNDYSDETDMWLIAIEWRGLPIAQEYGSQYITDWLIGYPPLYIWINIGIQQALEAITTDTWLSPADYMAAFRLVSALVSAITTLAIAAVAWQLGGKLAAWFAALAWAVSPIIIETGNLAIPDTFVYLAVAIALATAIRAWQTLSPRWAIVSLLAGIAAIYLKYSPVYALIPWGFSTLYLLSKQPRQTLPYLLAMIVIAAVSAGWLALGYDALKLQNIEANNVRDGDVIGFLLDPARNFNNGYFAIYPIGRVLFWSVMGGAALAYVVSLRRGLRRLDWRWLAIIALYCMVCVLVSALISNLSFRTAKIRFVLPATLGLMVLWGAGIAQISWALRSIKAEIVRRFAPIAFAAAVSVALIVPAIIGNAQMIEQFNRTDTRYLLWQWTDANIPDDGMILSHPRGETHRVWNRPWSGYDGVTPFLWWHDAEPWNSTPQQFVERGIPYFAMGEGDREAFAEDSDENESALDAFIAQLTLIKTIPTSADSSGPTVYFYRMLPPQFEAAVTLGGQIRLDGYDLGADTLAAGESLTFRPYWRIEQAPTANYSMFVHLYRAADSGANSAPIAQWDGAPTTSQRLPLTWDDPAELYIGADATLTVPENAEPGEYRLAVGLYDFNTGTRLLDAAENDAFTLRVEVRGPIN